jgi:aminoglycoside phosphotransferase (APT) family kinase protein
VGDLARIGGALAAVFPDLGGVTPVGVLGAGFRSVAVETAEGRVFRIARNPAAAAGHAREARLLPVLRSRVPVAIPDPRWHAGPSEQFPFGVIGYPKLPGTPLSPALLPRADEAAIAAGLGAFLLALHRFPPEEAGALGLPGPGTRECELATLRGEVLPPLREALAAKEYRAVSRWWDAFLADERMGRYPPVVRHGDLWYENILVDAAGRTVIGVVDFEEAAIGDPAQDFATQLHLGERFAARVIDAYRALGGVLDAGLPHRLRKLWELREFGGIQFAVRYDDPVEFADGVRKLRAGPILNRNAGQGRATQ